MSDSEGMAKRSSVVVLLYVSGSTTHVLFGFFYIVSKNNECQKREGTNQEAKYDFWGLNGTI